MRRVVIVTTVCPYPKNVGKHVIWGGLLDYLIERSDMELVIFSFAPFSSNFPVPVTVASRPGMREVLRNIFLDVIIRRRISIQEAFFKSANSAMRLGSLIRAFSPDLVIFDTIRTQQYAASTCRRGDHVFTYLDDLFSVRYQRVLSAANDGMHADKHVLGNFAEKLPGLARKVFDLSPWLRRAILNFEMNAVRRSEQRSYVESEKSLLISPAEVLEARLRCKGQIIEEIPPRMKLPAVSARNWDGSAEFLFLGSLKLSHNITAVEWFLERCFPVVLARAPHVKLKIIGAGSSDRLESLLARYPANVQKLGFVDSIDPHLLKACCLISPLLFGSGIKIKVIDALRCGLPVVTSSVGAEGIHGVDSGAITLAEGEDDFASAMLGMLEPGHNAAAAKAAAQEFRDHYSETSTQLRYDQIFSLPPERHC